MNPNEPPRSSAQTQFDDPLLAGQWHEILRSGERVLIRPLRKEDIELERRFLERLSPGSRRFRFLDTMKSPSTALLEQLVNIDSSRSVAFIALAAGQAGEQEIGVARWFSDPYGRNCEFAITVSDEWQRKGLGTVLMRHLTASAVARGLKSMYSIDAESNDPMRAFACHLGFSRETDPDDSTQVLHTLAI